MQKMATIPEAISIAIQHQQGGRLEIAESIYRQILEIDPKQVDAIHPIMSMPIIILAMSIKIWEILTRQ